MRTKKASDEIRTKKRANALYALSMNRIDFTTSNGGSHIQITRRLYKIDYWPSTDKMRDFTSGKPNPPVTTGVTVQRVIEIVKKRKAKSFLDGVKKEQQKKERRRKARIAAAAKRVFRCKKCDKPMMRDDARDGLCPVCYDEPGMIAAAKARWLARPEAS